MEQQTHDYLYFLMSHENSPWTGKLVFPVQIFRQLDTSTASGATWTGKLVFSVVFVI